MKSTLRFQADGGIVECLYTETIDLQVLGPIRITRATDISFNGPTQQWQVHDAGTDRVLFSNTSRVECLAWEHQNLQPRSNS